MVLVFVEPLHQRGGSFRCQLVARRVVRELVHRMHLVGEWIAVCTVSK